MTILRKDFKPVITASTTGTAGIPPTPATSGHYTTTDIIEYGSYADFMVGIEAAETYAATEEANPVVSPSKPVSSTPTYTHEDYFPNWRRATIDEMYIMLIGITRSAYLDTAWAKQQWTQCEILFMELNLAVNTENIYERIPYQNPNTYYRGLSNIALAPSVYGDTGGYAFCIGTFPDSEPYPGYSGGAWEAESSYTCTEESGFAELILNPFYIGSDYDI